jgi:hypothetical protein
LMGNAVGPAASTNNKNCARKKEFGTQFGRLGNSMHNRRTRYFL